MIEPLARCNCDQACMLGACPDAVIEPSPDTTAPEDEALREFVRTLLTRFEKDSPVPTWRPQDIRREIQRAWPRQPSPVGDTTSAAEFIAAVEQHAATDPRMAEIQAEQEAAKQRGVIWPKSPPSEGGGTSAAAEPPWRVGEVVPCRSGHKDCTVDCGWCKGTGVERKPVQPSVPPEPDESVKAVIDRDGVVWPRSRNGGTWIDPAINMGRAWENVPHPVTPLVPSEVAPHLYTSTYCMHALHEECRLTCKTCHSPCLCPCHREAAVPREAVERLIEEGEALRREAEGAYHAKKRWRAAVAAVREAT